MKPQGHITYVPIKPIVDYLGLAWTGQQQRVQRDPILSEVALIARQRELVTRINKAALIVDEHGRRITRLEGQLAPRQVITEEQAADVAEKVKALALALTQEDNSKNYFQSIFSELYRRFRVTSYKNIRQSQYHLVLDFLDEWSNTVAAGNTVKEV